MKRSILAAVMLAWLLLATPAVFADDPDAIARGKKALEGRAFSPAPWPFSAYENAWKSWQPKLDNAPEDYAAAFRAHYGLHTPPYDNGKYPMGMRPGTLLVFKGLTTDCMLCHGGSILGKSYVGLGNSALDIQAFFEDLNNAAGINRKLPHTFSNVRGTSEAGAMAVFLHSFRNPDLSLRFADRHKWELKADMCEDVPAWWLLKKKKTMYHTGSTNARSVRSIMQFMLTPNNSLAVFEQEEATFRDIQAYILSLEAAEVSVPHRYPARGNGPQAFHENLRQVPRNLRPQLDLSEQDHPAQGDRHRHRPLLRPARQARRLLQRKLVRQGEVGRDHDDRQRRLSGPAPRRRLGHRPLPAQRQRADAVRYAQLEDAAEAVHALLPHR